MARLESPLGVENGLVEVSPEAYGPEELYMARTLVRNRRLIPVRVLNASCHNQKPARGNPWYTVSQARW
jgi:hypothetical protein